MWKFGDVVRVDPANESVPQPDDRRWLILVPGDTSAGRRWQTLFVGPGYLSDSIIPWGSMIGFVRVEEDE